MALPWLLIQYGTSPASPASNGGPPPWVLIGLGNATEQPPQPQPQQPREVWWPVLIEQEERERLERERQDNLREKERFEELVDAIEDVAEAPKANDLEKIRRRLARIQSKYIEDQEKQQLMELLMVSRIDEALRFGLRVEQLVLERMRRDEEAVIVLLLLS